MHHSIGCPCPKDWSWLKKDDTVRLSLLKSRPHQETGPRDEPRHRELSRGSGVWRREQQKMSVERGLLLAVRCSTT